MSRLTHLPLLFALRAPGANGQLVATLLVVVTCMTACSTAADSAVRLTARLPGNVAWSDTQIYLAAGDTLSVTASGCIVARCEDEWGQGDSVQVGPEGTFIVSNALAAQQYPLAAGASGPAPCFALIGRIGNGDPFFVGQSYSRVVGDSGRLYLGINDFDCCLNTGELTVSIEKGRLPLTSLRSERVVLPDAKSGQPGPGCRVVVFYIDGLRPDVVQEMAAMGHLPNIRDLFLDSGVWMPNTFTAFPSDTITSNGTMWTGCFSDRHGLKGQVRFSRRTRTSESYLEPLGPSRSARLLQPTGVDRITTAGKQWLRGKNGEHWRKTHVTETPAIYHYLRQQNRDWSTGILPIMTDVPPPLWTRSMARELPWLSAHEAWQYIDDANTAYALRHLLHLDDPVTILWFPETDSVSHKHCRGQFGLTRRTIAKADRLIGRVCCELRETNKFESTFFVLVSDHGHHGGRVQHLRHFDLANDFFYQPRQVNCDGQWVGGGLGLSVRTHRVWNQHPEHHQREFAFIDGEADGAARVFLPRKCSWSRDWSGPNRPGDLLNYAIGRGRASCNLVNTLADARTCTGERAIDLVLMQLNENAILIATADRGNAVIDRRCDQSGGWEYRYRPVSRVWSDDNGGVFFSVGNSQRDPLGLMSVLGKDQLDAYHDERAWLNLTAATRYPDGVVSLTRHMLWQDNLYERQTEFAPDLVVTARPGWYFGTKSSPGSMHGYPLADAVRSSWFVSGPGVRRGARLDEPCRLVDLTPTLLDMLGHPVEQYGLDGRPVRRIYDTGQADAVETSITWNDVDLQSWSTLCYAPTPASRFRPKSVNQSDHPLDLSNTVYNIAAVADTSVFRVLDDVIAPLSECRPGPTTLAVEGVERKLGRSSYRWLSEGSRAVNFSEVALSDYTPYSLGNLWRISSGVDWAQARVRNVDAKVAGLSGACQTRTGRLTNRGIDLTQQGFWEAYRLGQRLVIRTVDETVINGIENTTDRFINAKGGVPAEVLVR